MDLNVRYHLMNGLNNLKRNNMKTKELEDGELGLIMITNGRVAQIGMTSEQSAQMKVILASLSLQAPLVVMG